MVATVMNTKRVLSSMYARVSGRLRNTTTMKATDISTLSKQTDHRNEIIAHLQGHSVVIPDLAYIYKDCEPHTNPDIDELRAFVEDWIAKYEVR
jgi:hypothetical protein